jgi:predicted nucleotidyltransferase
MSDRENIQRIKAVHKALGEELNKVVIYIGGAVVSLYHDRPSVEIRPTDDVDILVELITYKGYEELEKRLRARGFVNDIESGVICRYIIQGITVDVMPTSEKILGFANRWYKVAAAQSIQIALPEGPEIKIFSAVYFLATKIEAYKDRGKGDGRVSTDFEDIVFILNNRSTIWDEMASTKGELHKYLLEEFSNLLNEPYLDEWISSHLEYSEQKRVDFIIGSLREFTSAEEN